jgi:hypothetical protein
MMDVALVSPTEADAITIYEAYRQDHEPDSPKARPFGDQWLTHRHRMRYAGYDSSRMVRRRNELVTTNMEQFVLLRQLW